MVCVEIDPPKGISLERVYEQVDKIMASGRVDAIDINSGAHGARGNGRAGGRGRTGGARHGNGAAPDHARFQHHWVAGHAAGRVDSGRRAQRAGDHRRPASVGDYPETSGVYEVDSVGLVKVLHRLNQGTDWAGKTLGGATNFAIGVAVNPVADDLDDEIERFHAKVEAGAHFAMTQPLFDPAALARVSEKPGRPVAHSGAGGRVAADKLQTSAAVEQRSAGHRDSAGGVEVHGRSRERRRENVDLKWRRKMMAWARTEMAGAYLIPPFKRYEEILEMLYRAKYRLGGARGFAKAGAMTSSSREAQLKIKIKNDSVLISQLRRWCGRG